MNRSTINFSFLLIPIIFRLAEIPCAAQDVEQLVSMGSLNSESPLHYSRMAQTAARQLNNFQPLGAASAQSARGKASSLSQAFGRMSGQEMLRVFLDGNNSGNNPGSSSGNNLGNNYGSSYGSSYGNNSHNAGTANNSIKSNNASIESIGGNSDEVKMLQMFITPGLQAAQQNQRTSYARSWVNATPVRFGSIRRSTPQGSRDFPMRLLNASKKASHKSLSMMTRHKTESAHI